MSDDFGVGFDGVSPNDPYVKAWADQFGALIRDKIRQMIAAVEVTGWGSIAHIFKDPYDDDEYRLLYQEGEFWLANISHPDLRPFRLDLESLGVER